MLGLALIARYGAVSRLGWVLVYLLRFVGCLCCLFWGFGCWWVCVCWWVVLLLRAVGLLFASAFVRCLVGGLWWFFGCDCFRLCWLCGVFKFHIGYMGFRISFRFVFYWFAFRVCRDIACGLYGLFWLMVLGVALAFLVLMVVVLSLVWWNLVYCGTASGLVGFVLWVVGCCGVVNGCSFDGLHSSEFGYVWLGLLAGLLCIVVGL